MTSVTDTSSNNMQAPMNHSSNNMQAYAMLDHSSNNMQAPMMLDHSSNNMQAPQAHASAELLEDILQVG